MTPWTRGAFSGALWSLGAAVSGGAAAAAVWSLAPSNSLQDVSHDVEAALAYSMAWVRYLGNNGSWRVVYQSAQWEPLAIACVASVGAVVVAVCLLGVLTEQMRPKLFGTAAFATISDCQRMGIVGKSGNVVLGKFRGSGLLAFLGLRWSRTLIAGALRHVMIIAGTRSGKTAGIITPTVLEYDGSQIIIDPKRELLTKIAPELRRRGQQVLEIEWSNPASPHAWNPLALSVLPKNIVALESHCERVAGVIFRPSEAKGGSEKYFQENALRNAASLFLYAALDAQANGRDAHPSDALRLISDFKLLRTGGHLAEAEDEDLVAQLLQMIAAMADVRGYPARITEDLNGLGTMHPKQRDDHINTLKTGLQVFRSSAVQGSTRESSFSWQDLRDQKTAVFIAFPESDAAAYGRLTCLFFDTFFAWAVDTPPQKGEEAINVVADEFSSIPELGLLDSFLSKGAGNKATITMVVQSMKDLQKQYDQITAERLLENIDYFIIFAITDESTRRLFSGLAGTKSVMKPSRSGSIFGRSNVSEQEQPLPLILPEAFGELPFKQHLVFVKRHFTRPVICTTPLHKLMKPE